jgi:hypothetical protein
MHRRDSDKQQQVENEGKGLYPYFKSPTKVTVIMLSLLDWRDPSTREDPEDEE